MMRKAMIRAAVCCLVIAVGARGQVVRGKAVDAVSHAAISGALIELHDAAGNRQQTFTAASGNYLFAALAPGRYQVRIAAIGYSRHAPADVTVGTDPVIVPDFVMTPTVVTLPELHAMGGQRACGKSDLNAETFGGLLDGARTSLQVMDATLRSGQLGFQMQLIHRLATRGVLSRDSSVSADTSGGVLHQWPVQSLSPDSLQVIGFQRVRMGDMGAQRDWFGPDLQVLFSDWFLDTHCFTLDKKLSVGDTVVIKFDPTGKVSHVELSGELVLDRSTLTLRRMTYAHRHLPDGIPDRAAGGEMHFAEMSPGLWVPTDWAIWAPIIKVQRMISRPTAVVVGGRTGSRTVMMASPPISPLVQVVGRSEQRGHLTRVVPGGG